MLVSLKSLLGYGLCSRDGRQGKIHDFHFDNETWRVRHLAANTHAHLPWHRVLIAPASLGEVDSANRSIHVNRTRKEINLAPSISVDPPLSRRVERDAWNTSAWASYWTPYSGQPEPETVFTPSTGRQTHSLRHLLQYSIETAGGGGVGTVDDFVADDTDWHIASVIVLTRVNNVERRRVIDVAKVADIQFEQRVIALTVSKAAFDNAPEYETLRLRETRLVHEVASSL